MWSDAVFVFLVMALVAGRSAFSGDKIGWRDCEIEGHDHWAPGVCRSLSLAMHKEYNRRYTCDDPQAARSAAGYQFVSRCMDRTFARDDVRACLKGRRVIFLGDSLSTQQANSLVGMLGWHPVWLKQGHPQNAKLRTREDGSKERTLLECHRAKHDPVGGVERCFDLSEVEFAGAKASAPRGLPRVREEQSALFLPFHVAGQREHLTRIARARKGRARGAEPHGKVTDRGQRRLDMVAEEGGGELVGGDVRELLAHVEEHEGGEVGDEEHDSVTSVHLRMSSIPEGREWFHRSLGDFNETLASDVIVVNFGAHYRVDVPEHDAAFKRDVARLLDNVGEVADRATVIWREISPTHFPAEDGLYENFIKLPAEEQRRASCTGTPPGVDPRNQWVESYLEEKGLVGRIKILRVYRMSMFRGAAHHTCHVNQPVLQDFWQAPPVGDESNRHGVDCRHWSEPGVVEEWNRLLLNHLCPA